MLFRKNIETPLGEMVAIASDQGICLCDFTDRKQISHLTQRVESAVGQKAVTGYHVCFSLLEGQINAYFSGSSTGFDLPLHVIGTAFQQTVWQALMQIPYATTRTYKEQAVFLGDRNAVRAVAGANGQNGLAIIIPCHRVVGSNGTLTGYGGGLWRKQWLLEHERRYAGLLRQQQLF